MHKKTLETILDSKNDYVLQVKDNCPKLKKTIKEHTETQPAISETDDVKINKGRDETRIIEVYGTSPNIESDWVGIQSIIKVYRKTQRQGKTHEETHYYISSLPPIEAKDMRHLIRNHWFIENKLHWVKDVILKEDSTKCKDNDTYKRTAVFRNFVLNTFRLNKKISVKHALEIYNNDVLGCFKLLQI